MKLSIIMTTFNDSALIEQSIASLVNQTYKELEIIIVDDGSVKDVSKSVLKFKDKRIKFLQQHNDGLSSARNRGLEHVTGDYICFLDADDVRPTWFAEYTINNIKKQNNPDLILCSGVLSENNGELQPFYDSNIISEIDAEAKENVITKECELYNKLLPKIYLIEPQSANKVVKSSFLKESNIKFPNGLLFEDFYFHFLVIALSNSIYIQNQPCFSYFRRYARPQITSSNSNVRFDILSVANIVLQSIEKTDVFYNEKARTALVLNLFKAIEWCEASINHHSRYGFRELIGLLMETMNPLYQNIVSISIPVDLQFNRTIEYMKKGYNNER